MLHPFTRCVTKDITFQELEDTYNTIYWSKIQNWESIIAEYLKKNYTVEELFELYKDWTISQLEFNKVLSLILY